MDLIVLAVVFCAGLFVGWNFLPQPQWVKDLYAKFFGKKE